jgi:AbrB family looped-hinge helix DNA binding protein
MRTTIDAAGRVVVPKPIRERLGLTGGSEVEIEERDGVVELRPRSRGVVLQRAADGKLVLAAPDGSPPLTDEEVRRVLEDVRSWPRG